MEIVLAVKSAFEIAILQVSCIMLFLISFNSTHVLTLCFSIDGDRTCGGLVEEDWVVLYESPEECCSTEYLW